MKICANCKIEKEDENFHKSAKSGFQSYCKLCKKNMDAEIYRNNPKKKEKNILYKKSFREWYRNLKTNVPCKDCNKIYPHYIMQWDHIDDNKEYDIGNMASNGNNREKVLKEISKCELVCANCHFERTWQRRKANI